MKRILLIIYVAFIFLGLAAAGTARAQSDLPGPGDNLFSPEELDELLAPIALYPDPLLAQILPAATFIDQIDEAERYVRQYGKSARIDDQPWDISVKAVAHYPDILFMMDQKPDWTAALGQAFMNQEQDVMDAIQHLRAQAEDEGNLASTSQQEVYDEDDSIRIVPANPDLIYVPQYDPSVIYVEQAPSYGFITFSIGFSIGAWLDRDFDWRGHRVFYHGWQGGGWIGRARPHISDRRNIYINQRNAVINLNRTVVRHDTANFRDNLRHEAQRRVERAPAQASRPQFNQPSGRTGARVAAPRPVPAQAPRPQFNQPGGERIGARVAAPRPVPVPAPAAAAAKPAQRPDNSGLYRGRVTQGPQPAARSGYGGYGSGQDAAIYRQRGQASRENMGRFNQQKPQLPAQTPRAVAPQSPARIQQAPRQAAPAPAPRPALQAPAVPRQTPPAGRGGEEQKQHR